MFPKQESYSMFSFARLWPSTQILGHSLFRSKSVKRLTRVFILL